MHPRKIIILLSLIAILAPLQTRAQSASVDELQSKIDSRTSDIASLEKLISQYQVQLESLGSRETSLARTLSELTLTQKKLQADIALTQDKIAIKNAEIGKLSSQIGKTAGNIADNKLYVSESMKRMNELSTRSIITVMLSGDSLSDAWNSVNKLALMEGNLTSRIKELGVKKKSLETNRTSTEKAKTELVRLENQLNDQRKVVTQTANEQKALLAQTKNSEANYARLLKEKTALKNEFEQEILTFESQLKLSVDISKLPKTGISALSWPLDRIYITQYFGNTAFATANAQLYNGKGHNGIDLQATIGTPVKAALSGTILGTGNTDVISRCYSLGKWILMKHVNGLSTLYAHLSLQTVMAGRQVTTGDIIGYSGNTGYTTGPHLHFGVYASSGIEIKRFSNSRSCNGAVLPIAVLSAYLNPLSYLPASRN